MWMVRRCDITRWNDMTQWRNGRMRRAPDNSKLTPPKRVAIRYSPFVRDEIQTGMNTIHRMLPWWCPFNAVLHHWVEHEDELMHDHPRRSVTIVLRGEIIEKTPWGDKVLKPGAVVFRSHQYIHGFKVTREHSAKTWTLFIVGRRAFLQNTYEVVRRTDTPIRLNPRINPSLLKS